MLFVVGVLALGLAFAVKLGTVENTAGSNFRFDLFYSNAEQAAHRAHDEAVNMAALHQKSQLITPYLQALYMSKTTLMPLIIL